MRTAVVVAWEAAVKISLYWRYLCSMDGVVAACNAAAPGVAAAARAAAAAAGVTQHEEVVVHRNPSEQVGGAGLC